MLAKNKVDYTLAWRRLADVVDGNEGEFRSMFAVQTELDKWLTRWKKLHDSTDKVALASGIRSANPIYIPRNHLVEEALIAASDNGDLKPFEKLLEIVQSPFVEDPADIRFTLPASAEFTACYQTFCGT